MVYALGFLKDHLQNISEFVNRKKYLRKNFLTKLDFMCKVSKLLLVN